MQHSWPYGERPIAGRVGSQNLDPRATLVYLFLMSLFSPKSTNFDQFYARNTYYSARKWANEFLERQRSKSALNRLLCSKLIQRDLLTRSTVETEVKRPVQATTLMSLSISFWVRKMVLVVTDLCVRPASQGHWSYNKRAQKLTEANKSGRHDCTVVYVVH